MRLAAQGLRDLDDGPRRIDDHEERRAVREQARGVYLRAALATVALLALAMLLPT